eukprot:TRINITY_DN10597_c0_g1_i1.p1 TRINITY_DN10597_c0_g1~~TRINITY_DN10597_c0_g1_i1.p1  ORF type:complete len:189 (-),score=35.39 TRINITY_DN10597_c0_g1_i1:397-963(-)
MSSFAAFGEVTTERRKGCETLVWVISFVCLVACVISVAAMGWQHIDKDGVEVNYGLWKACSHSMGQETCVSKSDFDDALKNGDPALLNETNICRALSILEVLFVTLMLCVLSMITCSNKVSQKTWAWLLSLVIAAMTIANWGTYTYIFSKEKKGELEPSLYYCFGLQILVTLFSLIDFFLIKKYFVTD